MRKNSIITKMLLSNCDLDPDHTSYKLQFHLRVIRELRKGRGIMATKHEGSDTVQLCVRDFNFTGDF